MNAVERMKIPAGQIGVERFVRKVITALAILDDDRAVSLKIVRAEE